MMTMTRREALMKMAVALGATVAGPRLLARDAAARRALAAAMLEHARSSRVSSLHVLFPVPERADAWVRRPNSAPFLGGQSALDRMLAGTGQLGEMRARRLARQLRIQNALLAFAPTRAMLRRFG